MARASFTISVDTRDVMKAIDRLRREDAPFVTAYALTKTAQDIKAEEVKTMGQVFDRPTRFTLNALYVKTATKKDLSAVVEFKDGGGKSVPAWRYLGPQVSGGGRQKKSHERRLERAGILRSDEYVVPGQGVELDAYGNMRGGLIERILSQLQAAEQFAGYQANETARSRKRNASKRTGRYFLLRGRGAPDGIYHRPAGNTREIRPVMMFVKAPRYQKRFPFYEVAQKVFNDRFLMHARAGFERTIKPVRVKA
jgi:hypothetical protein